MTTMMCFEQLTDAAALRRHQQALFTLVEPWREVLQDYPGALATADDLVCNLEAVLPYVWVATTAAGELIAAATLSSVCPGRHAFIHGVKSVHYRKHPFTRIMPRAVLDWAFLELDLLKIKAEFEATNRSAHGFCLMYGFRREAYFSGDIRIGSTVHDVVIYSLHRGQWETSRLFNTLTGDPNHVIRS